MVNSRDSGGLSICKTYTTQDANARLATCDEESFHDYQLIRRSTFTNIPRPCCQRLSGFSVACLIGLDSSTWTRDGELPCPAVMFEELMYLVGAQNLRDCQHIVGCDQLRARCHTERVCPDDSGSS